MRTGIGRLIISGIFVLAMFPVVRGHGGSFETRCVDVAPGYSKTSVNTTIFRCNPLVTYGENQFVAFYDSLGYLTLGKRLSKSEEWKFETSNYKGNVADAHNVISIGIDGKGVVHAAFDHHGYPLRYCKGSSPLSMTLGDLQPMTGIDEGKVTYPEFHRLSNGDLLFAYRSGASGRGSMAINKYNVEEERWERVQDNLIDGEDERSPYWQMYVDENDVIHLSWVWRETWLVETNHDMCYAKSLDGGVTWLKSDGSQYTLPITASNAEYSCHIPQNSELINQTSMTADSLSCPYIASYWRDADSEVPQFRLIWYDGKEWHHRAISERTMPFSLSGGGTKMIPISRPRIVADGKFIGVIYRDEERGSKVSLAYSVDGPMGEWLVKDLTDFGVDAWEPSIDIDLWRESRELHMFVQETSQGDGEKVVEKKPTMISVLEVKKEDLK